MSYWNYRVGFKQHKVKSSLALNEYEEIQYGIVETYYNEDGSIRFTSAEFQEPYGETYEELIESLETMLSDARKHPILDLDELWANLKHLDVDDCLEE